MFGADQPAIAATDQRDVIEIVGHRAGEALKIDRRSYQVQQNPHTAQKDSLQLLRGLPAITVTPDDEIQLLGSAGVTIQVDGRTVTNPNTIAYLKTLHGSDIERIEIITNPSAQYAASGTGGIINFVLRKKRGEGTSGSVSAEGSSFGHGAVDGNVKIKRGKWTYEISAAAAAGEARRSTYHKLRSIERTPGSPATVNTEDGGGPSRDKGAFASGKITYDIDPRTSISANFAAVTDHSSATNTADFVGLTAGFQSFTQRQRFITDMSFFSSGLNFDHKGAKEGETLTATFRVYGNPFESERNSADLSNGGSLLVEKDKRFLSVDGQVDWQHPMGKGQILSVGGLWNYSRMREDYRFESSDTALGPSTSDQFQGVESTLAAYATFQQPIGAWTVMPGVRMERNSRHVTSPGQPSVDAVRTYFFPTLHVQRPLGKTVNLTLSYSKRIERPQLNDLRPYPLVQDVLTIKLGNPRLSDQLTDSYELNLQYQRNKVSAGLIVYDRRTRNIESSDYSVVNGINVFRLINAGDRRDRGAELDLSTPIIKRVKLNASLNLFDERAPVGTAAGTVNESRFRYTTNATVEWDGPDRGKVPGDIAELQWLYISPVRQFQMHDFAWNWFNLSYTHSFSRTLSVTATLKYETGVGHRLLAPLVQEYFSERRPVELKIKLLKTFGNSR